MSNHARRRRVFTSADLFPRTTRPTPGQMFSALMMRAKHDCHYEELGERMGALMCTCGFELPIPFGQPQYELEKEKHYAMFHVIPDPMGARYRA